MKYNYFSEVSSFFDIIPQNPDALVPSLHSFYNCHKQQHHLTALLISLCVILNQRVVVLTHCDQCVDNCWNCAIYNLHRQANLHCTLGTRLHVSFQSLSAAGDKRHICQLQYVLPLSSTSKLLATHSNLTLHICYTML
jgi:hypothetical protein